MILRQVHGLKQIVFLAADSQAEDCRYQTSILSDASVQRLHEDAGQAWRQRKTREALLHAAVGSDAIEQLLSALNGIGGWSVQPIDVIEMCDLHRPDAE